MSKKLSLSGSGEAHGNIQHGAPPPPAPRRQVQLWPATPKERARTTFQPHSLCSARHPSHLSTNLFLLFTKWHKHLPCHARQESGIHSDHLLPHPIFHFQTNGDHHAGSPLEIHHRGSLSLLYCHRSLPSLPRLATTITSQPSSLLPYVANPTLSPTLSRRGQRCPEEH